jgi:hypothetical protein
VHPVHSQEKPLVGSADQRGIAMVKQGVDSAPSTTPPMIGPIIPPAIAPTGSIAKPAFALSYRRLEPSGLIASSSRLVG